MVLENSVILPDPAPAQTVVPSLSGDKVLFHGADSHWEAVGLIRLKRKSLGANQISLSNETNSGPI